MVYVTSALPLSPYLVHRKAVVRGVYATATNPHTLTPQRVRVEEIRHLWPAGRVADVRGLACPLGYSVPVGALRGISLECTVEELQ